MLGAVVQSVSANFDGEALNTRVAISRFAAATRSDAPAVENRIIDLTAPTSQPGALHVSRRRLPDKGMLYAKDARSPSGIGVAT
jgi:hypothetical protein